MSSRELPNLQQIVSNRKLQKEAEQVFKKIHDGVDKFDDIWDRVHESTNPTQKEKQEGELKKEIKKLQRLREQVKNWTSSGDFKNKNCLLEYRKEIEGKMEMYKNLERSIKNKGHSDKKKKKKQRILSKKEQKWLGWVASVLKTIQEQIDDCTEEIANLQKARRPDQDEIEIIETRQDRHRIFTDGLELTQKLFDEFRITWQDIAELKDDVQYYVEENDSTDFMFDDECFDAIEAKLNAPPVTEREEITKRAIIITKSKSDKGKKRESKSSYKDKRSDKIKATSQKKVTSSSGSDLSFNMGGMSKPSPVQSTPKSTPKHAPKKDPPVSKKGKKSSSNSTSKKNSKDRRKGKKKESKNQPGQKWGSKSFTQILSQQRQKKRDDGADEGTEETNFWKGGKGNSDKNEKRRSDSKERESSRERSRERMSRYPSRSVESEVNDSENGSYYSSHNYTNTSKRRSGGGDDYRQDDYHRTSFEKDRQRTSFEKERRRPSQERSRNETSTTPKDVEVSGKSSKRSKSKGRSKAPKISYREALKRQEEEKKEEEKAAKASEKKKKKKKKDRSEKKDSSKSSRSKEEKKERSSRAERVETEGSGAVSSRGKRNVTHKPQEVPVPVKKKTEIERPTEESESDDSDSSDDEDIGPLEGPIDVVKELNALEQDFLISTLTDEEQIRLDMLERSLETAPELLDVENPITKYVPPNPCKTPKCFPQEFHPQFSDPQFFKELEVDTLFFAFYFQQGTYPQYLAAKELKGQSWRYHKKYLTWFQRHDQPTHTGDNFEVGTYVYFDYDSNGWCQRIKRGFRFEYSYLENELQ